MFLLIGVVTGISIGVWITCMVLRKSNDLGDSRATFEMLCGSLKMYENQNNVNMTKTEQIIDMNEFAYQQQMKKREADMAQKEKEQQQHQMPYQQMPYQQMPQQPQQLSYLQMTPQQQQFFNSSLDTIRKSNPQMAAYIEAGLSYRTTDIPQQAQQNMVPPQMPQMPQQVQYQQMAATQAPPQMPQQL